MNVDKLALQVMGAGSLRERLRLVSTHWSELRAMPRAERENVAIGLGSRWASRRLMRLLEADGKLTEGEALAQKALASLGSTDPRELRRLAAELQEGDLEGLEHVFVGALGSAVDERVREVEEAPPAAPPPLVEAEPRQAPQKDPAVLASQLKTVLAAVAARKEEAEREEHAERTDEESVPTVEKVEAKSEPERAGPAPSGAPTAAEEPDREPQLMIPEPALDETSSSGPPAGGWRDRRSLSARIREQGFSSLDAALAAVERLHSTDQRWCLGDLIENWQLDPESLERVLDASPDPRTRKRLQTRAASDSRNSETGS